MADVLTSNLYPPIIDTFMPAFVIDELHPYCKVYFELSDFNTIADIQSDMVQVSIRNQNSNENSLANPNGIRFYNLEHDGGGYHVKIYPEHLKDNAFQTNQYYKVQIRFTKAGSYYGYYIAGDADPEVDDFHPDPNINWINDPAHLNLYSEWSSVCLIRSITDPTWELYNFIYINNQYRYNSRLLRFYSKIKFTEKEYVKEYRVLLYEIQTPNGQSPQEPELFDDSGIQYPSIDNPNVLAYNFKKKMNLNDRIITSHSIDYKYKLVLQITTNSGYKKEFTLEDIVVAMPVSTLLAPVITTVEDEDQGRIKVDVDISHVQENNGEYYVALTRASSKTNYELWEEIALIPFYNGSTIVYFDYSIESGTWYKYTAQLFNEAGSYSQETEMTEPVCVLYEYMFLNSQNKQLKLMFDSHVTSYKRMVLESKVETLGSPYPFVRRNSATNYKQFSLTGTISFHSDDGEIFLTEDEIYGGNSTTITEQYQEYNSSRRIHPYNDYIKEREFREKVLDFINSGKVFLLRTMTEGLVLVRLMDLNITPNQSLNNYICNFTATAIEVAECSPENYYKYKIFSNLYSTTQLAG